MNPTPVEILDHLDSVMHKEVVDADADARLKEAGKRLFEDDKRAADLLIEIGTRISTKLEAWTMNVLAELTMASLVVELLEHTTPDADPVEMYAAAARIVERRLAAA